MSTKPKPGSSNMKNGVGIACTEDNLKKLLLAMGQLGDLEVLVGFPEDTTTRKPSPDEPAGMTNAAIAYVQDNGSPEQNIPARPFMLPAMANCRTKVADRLVTGARHVLANPKDQSRAVKVFMSVGIIAQNALRARINEGIPPPLSDRTLERRALRYMSRDQLNDAMESYLTDPNWARKNKKQVRKGEIMELARRSVMLPSGTQLAKPLIDTGQLRNAATYVIRQRSSGRQTKPPTKGS